MRRDANGSNWCKISFLPNGSSPARFSLLLRQATYLQAWLLIEFAEALLGGYASANCVAPSLRPLLEVQDPDLEPQTRCTPARCNNDVKRAIRDPRARVALLFGRCRFVTAPSSKIIQVSKIRFTLEYCLLQRPLMLRGECLWFGTLFANELTSPWSNIDMRIKHAYQER